MENNFKLELKEDKIVDILMHAATREDLNKLSIETKSDFEKLLLRIEKSSNETKEESASLRGDMQAEFASVRSEMKAESASLRSDMQAEFANVRSEMKAGAIDIKSETKAEFDKVRADILRIDNKLDRIVWGIIGSLLVPVVLHFLK